MVRRALRSLVLLLTLGALGSSFADIGKEQFLLNFLKPFQNFACRDNAVLRQCFDIKKEQCESSVARAYEVCRNDNHCIPEKIKTSGDAKYWGSQLSLCISRHFKAAHSKLHKSNSKQCDGLKINPRESLKVARLCR